MNQRSPIAVFFLSLITFGIYAIVWSVKTKNEMNNLGSKIPTAWLLIVPFVNIWWMWKYSEGVEEVTKGNMTAVISFVLLFLLGIIGMAIIQNEFNSTAGSVAKPSAPADSGSAPTAAAPPPPAPTQTV